MGIRLSALGISTCVFSLLGAGATAQPENSEPTVQRARRFGVSPPVRDLVGMVATSGRAGEAAPRDASLRTVSGSGSADGALQSAPIANVPRTLDTPTANFDGPSLSDTLAAATFWRIHPDASGAVGPNHYVAVTNLTYQVYDKSGNPQLPSPGAPAPVLITSIFAAALGGTGDPAGCEFRDIQETGYPNVLYDHLADRWLISLIAGDNGLAPFFQCVAVSQTGDPTGAYYVYEFADPNGRALEFPYFGLWPDGYYASVAEDLGGGSSGGGAHVFERDKMLRGEADARDVSFSSATLFGGLPSDLDGPPPAAGTPNVFAFLDTDEFGTADSLILYDFSVDWSNTANSTFTERTESPIAVSAFDPGDPSTFTIPQPLPANASMNLDTNSDRLMYRLQFRNFGTHTSLVTTHTVDADATALFLAGVRYYELRDTGSGYAIQEEATYAPDTDHRWMGSAAMDAGGNLAVGYSVASVNVFPSIRYAGRLAGDTPNGLAQGEQVLMAGTGIQSHTNGNWGEHAALTIDPSDDCTFWLIHEYYTSDDSLPGTNECPNFGDLYEACWHTRVGSFTFSGTGYSCAAAATGTLQGTVTDSVLTTPIAGATVDAGGYAAVTDGSGNYSIPNIAPGTYSVTASKFGYNPTTVAGVSVTASATTDQDLALTGIPVVAIQSVSVDDSAGNSNGEIDANECISVTVTLVNTGAADATGVTGVLSTTTPDVTLNADTSAFPDVAAGGGTSSNTVTFDFSTAPTFPAGVSPIDLTLDLTTGQGAIQDTAQLQTHIGTLGTPSRVENNTMQVIPEPPGGAINSPVTISGLSGVIADVEVELHLTHDNVDDLVVQLVGADGTTIVAVADHVGGSGNNCGRSTRS